MCAIWDKQRKFQALLLVDGRDLHVLGVGESWGLDGDGIGKECDDVQLCKVAAIHDLLMFQYSIKWCTSIENIRSSSQIF